MEELKQFDTPTITNVVATYPNDKENCLGLYHPWQGEWYTDQTLKCMYPELGRVVGYAVTCVYGLPDPDYKRHANIADVVEAINESPTPTLQTLWRPSMSPPSLSFWQSSRTSLSISRRSTVFWAAT